MGKKGTLLKWFDCFHIIPSVNMKQKLEQWRLQLSINICTKTLHQRCHSLRLMLGQRFLAQNNTAFNQKRHFSPLTMSSFVPKNRHYQSSMIIYFQLNKTVTKWHQIHIKTYENRLFQNHNVLSVLKTSKKEISTFKLRNPEKHQKRNSKMENCKQTLTKLTLTYKHKNTCKLIKSDPKILIHTLKHNKKNIQCEEIDLKLSH